MPPLSLLALVVHIDEVEEGYSRWNPKEKAIAFSFRRSFSMDFNCLFLAGYVLRWRVMTPRRRGSGSEASSVAARPMVPHPIRSPLRGGQIHVF